MDINIEYNAMSILNIKINMNISRSAISIIEIEYRVSNYSAYARARVVCASLLI